MTQEIPIYYKKIKEKLGDCKEGDWVYNSSAHLCYVTETEDGYRKLHYYAIECSSGNDTIVYPISLTTAQLAKQMTEIREKYHKARIMNGAIGHELDDYFDKLMNIDDEEVAEDTSLANQYDLLWGEINKTLEERLECARKLKLIC